MSTPTLAAIAAAWLKANGYDGLCPALEWHCDCGCGLDDLMPCDEPGIRCVAAWRCNGTPNCDDCTGHDETEDAETWYCADPKAKEQHDERDNG